MATPDPRAQGEVLAGGFIQPRYGVVIETGQQETNVNTVDPDLTEADGTVKATEIKPINRKVAQAETRNFQLPEPQVRYGRRNQQFPLVLASIEIVGTETKEAVVNYRSAPDGPLVSRTIRQFSFGPPSNPFVNGEGEADFDSVAGVWDAQPFSAAIEYTETTSHSTTDTGTRASSTSETGNGTRNTTYNGNETSTRTGTSTSNETSNSSRTSTSNGSSNNSSTGTHSSSETSTLTMQSTSQDTHGSTSTTTEAEMDDSEITDSDTGIPLTSDPHSWRSRSTNGVTNRSGTASEQSSSTHSRQNSSQSTGTSSGTTSNTTSQQESSQSSGASSQSGSNQSSGASSQSGSNQSSSSHSETTFANSNSVGSGSGTTTRQAFIHIDLRPCLRPEKEVKDGDTTICTIPETKQTDLPWGSWVEVARDSDHAFDGIWVEEIVEVYLPT